MKVKQFQQHSSAWNASPLAPSSTLFLPHCAILVGKHRNLSSPYPNPPQNGPARLWHSPLQPPALTHSTESPGTLGQFLLASASIKP